MSTTHVMHGVVTRHEVWTHEVTKFRGPADFLVSETMVTAKCARGAEVEWVTATPPPLGAVVNVTVEVRP
jgi:hypothetical protein